ncbi:MAG: hypothetical protein HUU54_10450 [Ignavibacteriaceae bacterium]|nr:hypothetical protein [Ignavibacteriaceae bacterium]
MIKKILFISCFLFSMTFPQAADYSFSSSNSTYAEISDGTQSTATGDDGGENISLPFTFVYNGIAYNNARISTNGWPVKVNC